jgi:hypothetical protein
MLFSMDATGGIQREEPGELRGRELRYLLTTLLLEARRPLSVAELVALCEAEGVVFARRASKMVSDALRWEIGWRRVARVSRGVYRYRGAPRSTKHWIRGRVNELREYLSLVRLGMTVPFPYQEHRSTAGGSP